METCTPVALLKHVRQQKSLTLKTPRKPASGNVVWWIQTVFKKPQADDKADNCCDWQFKG